MAETVQLMKAIETDEWMRNNYLELQEKYAGKVIAVIGETVVAWGNTIYEVLSALKEKGINAAQAIVEYIRKKDELIII